MPRHSLRTLGQMLGLLLILGAAPAMAASQPTLFTLASGAPKVLAQGAQKSWPIKISEGSAFDAIFQGGMWLPTPSGGRIYAKYQRHILHDNGTWTWVGTVPTVHGDQSVVLTFGKDAAFGMIPQASGYPLRIVTNAGQTRVVETSAAMARSAQQLGLHSKQDYFVPPRPRSKPGVNTLSPQTAASAPVQAAASGGTVNIDVMVAYTTGFVSELGTQRSALVRIQNLVDITNQAYIDSGVNQQIRLVNTVEVNYPDNTSNDSALDDITGLDTNGNPVSIPPSLQGIAALRVQYGADLVALIRSYDNATQGNCGVGWLIGGGQTQIDASQAVYGYSVVSDGSNGGYYCLDTTFAHELGHNMGDAHDRANADESGAYSYSYGYQGNGTNGFSTIMAYGTATSTPLSVFSNPNISICQNTPCGVADSSSSSADNAHSMNNTAALIAQFEPTKVTTPPALPYAAAVHNDVNGDGKSDLLWFNPSPDRLSWWIMNGATMVSHPVQGASTGWKIVATGDFNGDGLADIVWTDSSKNVYIWLSKGNGFTSTFVANVAKGWTIIGSGDFDGDGRSDLLWYNPSPARISWWLMAGTSVLSHPAQSVNSGWHMATIGDFYGNGKADIVWTDPSNNVYFWSLSGTSFTSTFVANVAKGWSIVGSGDLNGDGKADLFWFNGSPWSRLSWWLMNGSTILAHPAQAVDGSWRVSATGDFNGDGKTQIVWTDAKGNVYFWSLAGSSFTSQTVGSVAAGWSLVP